MGCKKCKDKKKAAMPINAVRYIFCPSCDSVIAKRIKGSELIGYKCEKCGGKTANFMRPPSKNRLKLTKERIHG